MELLLWALIVWVLPCFVAHKIAIDRNRTGSKAVLAAIVFGWFAVIAIAVFLKPKKKEEQDEECCEGCEKCDARKVPQNLNDK
jgi:succinate dehydrogenase/fumarate reductase flavoprotein subunit